MGLTDALTIRPLLKRLERIEAQLQRIGDLYETDLADRGLFIRPPAADTSGEEPEAFYTDEEMDAVREVADLHKLGHR